MWGEGLLFKVKSGKLGLGECVRSCVQKQRALCRLPRYLVPYPHMPRYIW